MTAASVFRFDYLVSLDSYDAWGGEGPMFVKLNVALLGDAHVASVKFIFDDENERESQIIIDAPALFNHSRFVLAARLYELLCEKQAEADVDQFHELFRDGKTLTLQSDVRFS